MVVFVGSNFHPDREAVQAEVKVCTYCALDADRAADIFLAVVAVIERRPELAMFRQARSWSAQRDCTNFKLC